MAQSERFYFWRGYYDALKMLPTNEQRGDFVMYLCAYAFDGTEPEFTDPTLAFAWAFVRDQVAESVEIGREMARRGRASGEARRNKSGTNTVRNTVRNTVPNEGKGTDRKGSDLPPSGEGVAPAADAAALRPGETEDERIERVYGPQPRVPPKPEGT